MNIKNINFFEVVKVLLILLLVIVILNFKSIDLNVNSNTLRDNTITISGKSEKKVVPDTARISFSINEYNKDQKAAAEIVNRKTKKIIETIKSLDIEDKDIKTKSYSIYPEYNWNEGKRTFNKYRASQSVEIIVRDLDKTSKVLSATVDLGVDNLNGPNMFVDNLDKVKDSLRSEAITNAKEKAENLASELGVSLDKIVGFYENDNNNKYPVFYAKAASLDYAEESVSEPEINPGEENIVKTVNITFQIKD